MTKVLYVENTMAILGGMERVLVDKLNWLVKRGDCEICLLTTNQGTHPLVFPLPPQVEYHDLDIIFHQKYRYSGWRRYREEFRLHCLFQHRLAEQIRAFAPQIIVCTRLDYIYDVMRVRGDIPVVFESHNSCLAYKFENDGWLRRIQFRFWHYVMRKAQMVVAFTQGDAVEWEKRKVAVKVIPNVVHLNATGRISDCSSKSVIFVGRYSYQKDIRILLKIWEIVHQRYPDWQLHLFGDYGDERDLLQREIAHSDENIVMHEPTAAIFDEYLKSSMLLLTSRYEPFGLVLPEAMSCGLPVVAFDCPYGPADIISDGVDGFLIKDRSVADFAEKVCLLIENEALRRKMGEAGMRSSRRFEADCIMPQWKELFEKLSKK